MAVPLRAGPLQLALLPEEGAVRSIYAGEHEILHGIGVPVRDQFWGTVRPSISDVTIGQKEDSFKVAFRAHCREGEVNFLWNGQISGLPDGTLRFDFVGQALERFSYNRIGFCVLHPAAIQGAACTIEHVDGRLEEGKFPESISPHQPFFSIRAIFHEVGPGLRAEVRLEGDEFEMEDQRNWTDASFKTYCTPLARLRPALIEKGACLRQRVIMRLHGSVAPPKSDFAPPWNDPAEVTLEIGPANGLTLPALGAIWNASEPAPALLGAMRPLGLAHLRLDLRLAGDDFATVLQQGVSAASALAAKLELAVFVDGEAPKQLERLRGALDRLSTQPRIARWLVFHRNKPCPPAECVAQVRKAFAASPYEAPMGGGALDNFTELNREPAIAEISDFTLHACNPQVHAFDDDSLVETLAIQGLTVMNAKGLSKGLPVVISPVTLTRRWRPGEAGGPDGPTTQPRPFQTDARHRTFFGAVWALGSLNSLTEAGAASVTYFEVQGRNGLFSDEGAPLPVAGVFTAVAPYAGARAAPIRCSHPHRVSALALEQGRSKALFVGNLGCAQRVRIAGSWGERTLVAAGRAITRIDLDSGASLL